MFLNVGYHASIVWFSTFLEVMALPERIIREVHHFSMPPLYKNVAIYCRVSSRFQEQLDSAANQASFFVKMVAKRNGWKLVDIFLDFRSVRVQRRDMNFCE